MAQAPTRSLRVLHVLRAPVGGLFRHVVDLARGQVARGHAVGLIVEADPGSQQAEATLEALRPDLALGLTRIPMSRHIGWSDLGAARHVAREAKTSLDVLHGHGAKGGPMPALSAPRRFAPIRPTAAACISSGRPRSASPI